MISVMEKVRSNVRSQLFEREIAALTGEMLFSGGNRSVGQMCTDMSYVVTEVPGDCIRVDLVSEAACMPPALENLDNYLLTDWACMMPDVLRSVSETSIVANGYMHLAICFCHRLWPASESHKGRFLCWKKNGMVKNFTDDPKSVIWLIGLRKKIKE